MKLSGKAIIFEHEALIFDSEYDAKIMYDTLTKANIKTEQDLRKLNEHSEGK